LIFASQTNHVRMQAGWRYSATPYPNHAEPVARSVMATLQSIKHAHSFKDMAGQRIHMLTVVSYAGRDARGQAVWLCRCECGTEKTVNGSNLRRGHHKSCGCLSRRKKPNSVSAETEFRAYCGMLARCHGSRTPARYGKRGIKVCERWRAGFQFFIADMGVRPSDGYSIERIDNDGDYCPENCRWATAKEQARNRYTNRIIECFGLRLTLAEWAERTGISRITIASRLGLHGWSAEKALTTPAHPERLFCGRGHALSDDNLRIDTRGYKRCRACEAARGRRRHLAERATHR
jgi:hypothetical protein